MHFAATHSRSAQAQRVTSSTRPSCWLNRVPHSLAAAARRAVCSGPSACAILWKYLGPQQPGEDKADPLPPKPAQKLSSNGRYQQRGFTCPAANLLAVFPPSLVHTLSYFSFVLPGFKICTGQGSFLKFFFFVPSCAPSNKAVCILEAGVDLARNDRLQKLRTAAEDSGRENMSPQVRKCVL